MAEPDHYQALGVDRGATASEIRSAFKTAARRWHPDKNLDDQEEATARFKKITCAYDVLSDEQKRREYDRKVSEHGKRHQACNDNRGSYQGQARSWTGKSRSTSHWQSSSSRYSRTSFTNKTHRSVPQGPKPKQAKRVPTQWSHQNAYSTLTSNGYQHSYVYGIPQSSRHWTDPGQASYSSTSLTIRQVNGRTVTTETKVENGVTTFRVCVNGILTSETVQGQAFRGFGC